MTKILFFVLNKIPCLIPKLLVKNCNSESIFPFLNCIILANFKNNIIISVLSPSISVVTITHTNTRCICCKVLNVETEAHHKSGRRTSSARGEKKFTCILAVVCMRTNNLPAASVCLCCCVARMLWPVGAMRQQDRTALVPPGDGEVATPARSVFSAASVGGADDHRRTFSMRSTGKATRRKKHGRSEPLLLALSHAALQRRFAICPCSPRRRQTQNQ